VEHLRSFAAFASSFDGADDDDGDGRPDTLGVPQWVAYQIQRHAGPIHGGARPSVWATDPVLAQSGLAPADDTYQYSAAFRKTHPNWYVRGHLAMKHHADRLGPEAGRQTHTMLNAVPQRTAFNSGIWEDLECRTGAWADQYGGVWIVVGPVLNRSRPRQWLGEPEKGERRSAIPDALFKVVAREGDDPHRPKVLGFVYPQEDRAYAKPPYPHERFLVSLDSIEELTGLDFLTSLPEGVQRELESVRPRELWPVEARFFDAGCRTNRRWVEAGAR
jgi:DNA/RNA endonuclease G (NUC1)